MDLKIMAQRTSSKKPLSLSGWTSIKTTHFSKRTLLKNTKLNLKINFSIQGGSLQRSQRISVLLKGVDAP